MKLVEIPREKYSDYRLNVIFNGYKWDPQVGDHNTIERHALILGAETVKTLEAWAEKLSAEVFALEDALIKDAGAAVDLKLPRRVARSLKLLKGFERERHVRLMRFDFHPTDKGWAVSEVNSDVPGGFAEGSLWQRLAAEYFDGCIPCKNPAAALIDALAPKMKSGGTVAFVHATAYTDDRQIMQYLSDCFTERGFKTLFLAPDHINWTNKRAVCILSGEEGREIDAIVRYFPLEWMVSLPKKIRTGYYDSLTPSCNPASSIFAQSKRLPLLWDKLGVPVPTWRELLPQTVDPASVASKDGWILKPALGRVGADISIKEAMPERELKKIERAARRRPWEWVAQRRFESKPFILENGEACHVCVGVFTIDGRAAGFYGRTSPYPRIDTNSKDIPVLIGQ